MHSKWEIWFQRNMEFGPKKHEKKLWAKMVWDKIHVPKMAVCLFKVLNNYVATKDRLTQKRILIDSTYVLCNNHEETLDHLFFQCEFSKLVWKWCWTNTFVNISRKPLFDLTEIYDLVIKIMKRKNFQTDLILLGMSMTIWSLRKEWNHRAFQQKNTSANLVCMQIKQLIRIRISKSKHLKNINPKHVDLVKI